MAWLGLLATLAWNYARHRRGRSTICSVTRSAIPPGVFVLGWGALTAFILRHILGGYPDKETSAPSRSTERRSTWTSSPH